MSTQSPRRSASQNGGHDIVVEAAWLYYQDGLNQNEIAARFKVSRATVVNYLQEARERGYVQITLSPEAFKGHEGALQL
ncbi:MAG: MarR family transcriptional regulator, partial [Hyphomicrobiales bacterium]